MRKHLLAGLLALVVTLVACGGGGTSPTGESSNWDAATFDSATWK